MFIPMLQRLSHFARWFQLVTLLTCAACGASAEVKTTRDPRFTGTMHSLHVVINQAGIDPDFATELDKSLRTQLGARGVAYSSRILTGLELDQSAIAHEVQSVHPDGLLLLLPTRGTTYYGEIVLMTYDARLFEGSKGATVWRGRIESKRAAGAYGTVAGMMEETAKSIAAQLQSDGLLARRQ
jgi:hypothetical protein